MKPSARAPLDRLCRRYPALEGCRAELVAACALLADSFRAGGKLLVCGNGGSAADSQHIVGELMKGFVLPRRLDEGFRSALEASGCERPDYLLAHLQGALSAVSLVGETALSTAFANDQAPDLAFAQQVLGLGRPGDALLGISTSGDSLNVLYAADVARALGLRVIGLTGQGGGRLAARCDVCIAVPAKETCQAQEYHLPVYHALCMALEEEFFGGDA